MKINWGFGPPKDNGDGRKPAPDRKKAAGLGMRRGGLSTRRVLADAAVNDQPAPESEQHGWTYGASMTTKSITWLLWAALVAGPVALALQLLFPSAPPVVQQSGNADRSGEVAAVSEFAERAVAAWLETPSDEAEELELYFGDLDQRRPAVPWRIGRTRVAEIVKDESGLWSVVVGIDMTEGQVEGREPAAQPSASDETDPEAGGNQLQVERVTSGRAYFRIPILYVEGEMVAQALPSPVPPPTAAESLETLYREELAADHPAWERVGNFLNAMLVTGNQADVEAYSSPGVTFQALNPVPYAALTVNSIVAASQVPPPELPQDGERADVLVTVSLEGSNGQELEAQYAMTLLARQGRWEVADLPATPLLAVPVPIPTPTSEVSPRPQGSPASGSPSTGATGESSPTGGMDGGPESTVSSDVQGGTGESP